MSKIVNKESEIRKMSTVKIHKFTVAVFMGGCLSTVVSWVVGLQINNSLMIDLALKSSMLSGWILISLEAWHCFVLEKKWEKYLQRKAGLYSFILLFLGVFCLWFSIINLRFG